MSNIYIVPALLPIIEIYLVSQTVMAHNSSFKFKLYYFEGYSAENIL